MIYTVTLNPSIDYIVRLDELKTGITNRTTSEEYYIGGKGINVSCVLAELGIKSTALGFVAGFTGEAIEKGLKNPKITADFITLKSGISRINIKIKAGEETEINCQGPHIDEEELLNLFDKIDNIQSGDTLIVAGNIPNTLPDDVYERIIERLDGKDVRIVVDTTVKTESDVVKYAQELQKMGAKNVLVSLGGDGALLVDEFGKVHKEGVIKGHKVLNTVGSGDSMVAGFVAGCIDKNDYAYALKLGSACGNATAFLNGLATKDKIDELLAQF